MPAGTPKVLVLLVLAGFSAACEQPAADLPYGATVDENGTTFRFFAPKAEAVYVVLFDSAAAETGREYPLKAMAGGDWTGTVAGVGYGAYYGYRSRRPAS